MTGTFLKKFQELFTLTRIFANILGVDVLQEDYRYNWRTYILYSVCSLGCTFVFYNIYLNISIGLWPPLLISLAIIGPGIQGYVKLSSGTRNENIYLLRYMYQTISDIYAIYEGKSLDYDHELNLSLSRVNKVLSTLFILAILALVPIIGVPLLILIVKGQRTFILNFFLPFIDLETDFGYFLTFFIHSVCVAFASIGNFINDSFCFTYVAHVPLISSILKCKIRDLDNVLQENPNDMSKSKPILIDILKWHQQYNDFNQALEGVFYWVIFVQIGTQFVSIISTIVCIFLNAWPAAPAFLIYSFALFYCFCAVGNIVEDANSDVVFYIYDSYWYLLTSQEQKMVLYMLRNAQQATGITIGDVAPLSMSTALQMTKTFYTMSMLLREFLND